MTVTEITSFEQFQEVINGDRPVIIDFYAVWCGPCKLISPIFQRFSGQPDFSEYIDFYEVNVDHQRQISTEAHIRAMPTFIAYAKGEQIGTVMGASPKSLLKLVTTTAGKAAAALKEQS